MRRFWSMLKRTWWAIRQILSLRGLLVWLGWWQATAAMMVGIAASIWTYLHGLPGPIVATIGLVVFTLCVVLWRAFQMAKAGTLYTQEFRAVKAPYQGVLTVKLIKPVWWQRVLNSLGNWRKKT